MTPGITRADAICPSATPPGPRSEQTFLNRGQFPLVTKIEERLARYTMLPWQNGEDMQILKYGIGQKYDAHHDVGELTSKSGQQLAADGGYRVATVLLYLTDTEEGGETAFPDSEVTATSPLPRRPATSPPATALSDREFGPDLM